MFDNLRVTSFQAPIATPTLVAVSQTPRLYVADGFLTRDEITHVLACGNDDDALAARGVTVRHDRSGRSCELPVDGDPVLSAIRARVEQRLGVVNLHGSTMRFRHYDAGEEHPPHLDCYEIAGSHLVITALMHLLDCPDGGDTTFPRAWPAPVSIRPKAGRLVAWFNYYPNGARDEASYHLGSAVRAGHKATITAFIYAPLDAARVRPAATPGWIAD